MRSVVIIGAGPTGLSASYHLGADAVLLEQNDRVGGWCRSIEVEGFTFDYAGHILFSNDTYVHELYRKLLGDNIHWQDREAWIYSNDVYTRYPFQGALHGLPPSVIADCLIGAIEARYGSAAPAASHPASSGPNGNNGHASQSISDCCADGVLEATAPLSHRASTACSRASGSPGNFEEFIHRVWGAGIAKHFAIPYNRKLWTVPLNEMETSWLGGRVPLPDLREMVEGALEPVAKPMGPNARFGYVLQGGCQALMDGFLPYLKGELALRTSVQAICLADRTVRTSDGRIYRFNHLISTMPLPKLVGMLASEAPLSVRQAAAALRHISVRCVHLGIGREKITDKHWIYYPGDTVFHRMFIQGNASPYCNPPGGFGLTCEISYSPYKPLPCDGDALVRLCIDDCRRVGLIGESDPIWATAQVDLPYAYVVYDHARAANVAHIRQWLTERGIVLAGRYSEWEYYNSDHAFLAGKRAAEQVRMQRSAEAFISPRRSDSPPNQYA
jgi:UDP-galactopyranose mutase